MSRTGSRRCHRPCQSQLPLRRGALAVNHNALSLQVGGSMQWIMLHLNLAGLSYSSRLLLALSILAAALWLVLTAGLHIVGMWSADAGSTSYLARWMNSK